MITKNERKRMKKFTFLKIRRIIAQKDNRFSKVVLGEGDSSKQSSV